MWPSSFRAGVTLALSLAVLTSVACDFGSPTRATRPATLDGFAGAWSGSGTAVADGCTQLEYEITPAPDGRSATIRFDGTCAGITASGTGSGLLSGETLLWNAEGTASGRGMTCPFSFADNRATREGARLRVEYAGTVCGFPVKGSELLARP